MLLGTTVRGCGRCGEENDQGGWCGGYCWLKYKNKGEKRMSRWEKLKRLKMSSDEFFWLGLVCLLLLIGVVLSLSGCGRVAGPVATPDPVITVRSTCEIVPNKVHHSFRWGNNWEREVTFPTHGRFVVESHYVTRADKFPGRYFANTSTEGITDHLHRSCLELAAHGLPCVNYAQSWEHQWTPAESGKIGQGARGNQQAIALSSWDEMWLGTQMWGPGEIPEPGTKYLLTANGRSLVVQFGWETGPASQSFLGGLTVEAHKYLGTSGNSEITIGLLLDQSVNTGPTKCVDIKR